MWPWRHELRCSHAPGHLPPRHGPATGKGDHGALPHKRRRMDASMAKGLKKTNAMRELERAGVSFILHTYEVDESDLSGLHVAAQLGETPGQVFKTLVTTAPDGSHAACCVPVDRELDLKAAARAFGVKSLSMLHLSELLPVTGYVRGGCSPVGMKRPMPVVIDAACERYETIMISGGRRGLQLELDPRDLITFCDAIVAAIATEE